MSVDYKDYYKLLGVSKTASKDEISKAFKKLARQYHPDLNPGDDKAEAKFKEVNEAYEVLKDEEKRRMYDQLGPNWQNGQNFQRPPGFENVNFGGFNNGQYSDFFETIFGGGGFQQGGFGADPFGGYSRRPRKGRDVEATLSLTLEEAFSGGRKAVTVRDTGPSGMKRLEVTIPAGVKDGAKIRLSGQGDQGMNGGAAGDLYLKVHIVSHPIYSLDGANVLLDLPITPWEAVLGGKVRVPTLEGAIELNIAPGTSSGRKLRLRGKGLGAASAKGDQLIRIVIKVPEELTDEERELWEKLSEVSQMDIRNFD